MAKITVNVKTQVPQSGIEVLSLDPPFLKIRTSKPPEKNLANEDILKQLSQYFSYPKSQISIVLGHSKKKKLIEIPCGPEKLLSLLREKENFLL